MYCQRRELNPSDQRRGIVVLVVLIALLFMTIISASLVQMALADRRQMRREMVRMQSEWIADAARQRAVWQLSQNADYEGEKWEIAVDGTPASVAISVGDAGESPHGRNVQIVADFPIEPARRARVVKSIAIPPTTQASNE